MVNVKRASKGRPPDVGKFKLPLLYTTPRKIKKAKPMDLIELLQYTLQMYNHIMSRCHISSPSTKSNTVGVDDLVMDIVSLLECLT